METLPRVEQRQTSKEWHEQAIACLDIISAPAALEFVLKAQQFPTSVVRSSHGRPVRCWNTTMAEAFPSG